jgi:hypothetical protein
LIGFVRSSRWLPGMASVVAPPGDVLTLQLDEGRAFARRCPEQYAALVECAAFVNWRRIEVGDRPIVALSFRSGALLL